MKQTGINMKIRPLFLLSTFLLLMLSVRVLGDYDLDYSNICAGGGQSSTDSHTLVGSICNAGVFVRGFLDTDGDGLSDLYEVTVLGTNPDSIDSDGDGLADGESGLFTLEEYFDAMGYAGVDADEDGYVDGESEFGTDPVDADTDDDGMPDGWEVGYSLDPNDDNDADGDADSDGKTNLQEYQASSDPYIYSLLVPSEYSTIQSAIDDASDFDEIVVAQDTYYESIDFGGKPIHLRSTDPSDPNVVENTVIDANSLATNVVYFHTGEDANSILDGFTITGGDGYGVYCAGSYGAPISPAIRHCVIKSSDNFGVYVYNYASPVIEDCIISENTEGVEISGYGSDVLLLDCQIINNYYGVLSWRGETSMLNCIISNNDSTGIAYAITSGNEHLYVDHCTIVGNLDYGLHISGISTSASHQIINSILWDNGDDLLMMESNFDFSYCCIEDMDEGAGVIHSSPLFVDASGDDYHLNYGSSCIGAGDDGSNLGAYGGTFEATVINDPGEDGLSDDWQRQYWAEFDPDYTDPNEAWAPWSDPDGDGLRNKDEYYIAYDPNSNDGGGEQITALVENNRLGLRFPSITQAIDFSENGDMLIAAQGTYYESIDFKGKPVHLRSGDPNDLDVIENTVIDGNSLATNVVYFHTGEDANTIIDGFTVTGGTYGVYCKGVYIEETYSYENASPLIRNCVIEDNSSCGVYITHNALPIVENCIVKENTIAGVYVYGQDTEALLLDCQINDNDYGVYCPRGGSSIQNCVIANNNMYGITFNYYYDDDYLYVDNCTIVGNTTYGLFASSSSSAFQQITNSILWDNDDDLYIPAGSSFEYSYCCIEDTEDSGTGVIHSDPLFADLNNGDYHLKSPYGRWNPSTSDWTTDPNQLSPCIDAGDLGSDYSNEPNIPAGANGGRVNMGAYGNTPHASKSDDE